VKKIDYTKYPLPRIRHHANPGLYFPLSQHKTTDLRYPPVIKHADWKDFFQNGRPPEYLDVGCGLGKFLIDLAANHPNINMLGLEIRNSTVEWTNNILNCEGITNAKALWYSAVNGMPFIESGSIEKIFYFFPDPWHKKRHHKRRAFSAGLLDEFQRVIKPNGRLYIMTDVPEVDEYQQEILTQHNGFTFSYAKDGEWDLDVETNHEGYCNRRNIPFIRMICQRKEQ
jgi:tRNA (guanine-N7-)-methyltransferase